MTRISFDRAYNEVADLGDDGKRLLENPLTKELEVYTDKAIAATLDEKIVKETIVDKLAQGVFFLFRPFYKFFIRLKVQEAVNSYTTSLLRNRLIVILQVGSEEARGEVQKIIDSLKGRNWPAFLSGKDLKPKFLAILAEEYKSDLNRLKEVVGKFN